MNIYNEYSKPLGKTVTVYEYNADDEDPDCMKCVHVCDSRKVCDECGAFWINYLRREYIDEDTSNEGLREIYNLGLIRRG